MTVSLSEVVLPSVRASLQTIAGLLDKAAIHVGNRGVEPEELFGARLAEDMFDLVGQVDLACGTARRGVQRLSGVEVDLLDEPQRTFDGLRARVAESLEIIGGVDAKAIDAAVDRSFEVSFGPRTLHFTGRSYAFGFVLPNTGFHVAIAYGLVRQAGVPVGKLDYLGPFGSAFGIVPVS